MAMVMVMVLSPLDVGRIARASRPGTAQPRPASAGGVKGLETVAETHAAPSAASSISSNPCAGMLREHNTRPSRLRPQSAAAAPGRRGPLPAAAIIADRVKRFARLGRCGWRRRVSAAARGEMG